MTNESAQEHYIKVTNNNSSSEMVFTCSGKAICTQLHLSEVSSVLHMKQFGPVWSDWQWPFLVCSRKITKHFLFPHLSPPGDWWCDVFGFVPAGSVSSSLTLQIFCGANHLWWLHCLLACLLGRFHWLLHVKASSMSTGIFQGWCWTLSHANLLFPRQKRNWN